MINIDHMTGHLIEPALWYMEEKANKGRKFYSLAAVRIIGRSAAAESECGTYVRQLGNGPALGLLQIEPDTCADVWVEVLARHRDIENVVRSVLPAGFDFRDKDAPEHLIFNYRYNIMIGRLCFWRHKEPLPPHHDVTAQFHYYKKYFNSVHGASTLESWLAKDPYKRIEA